MRVGVDTGGTFTDCVVFEGGEARILKVFSTPSDASRAIIEGVRPFIEPHASKAGVSAPLEILHGTTVGTNSLLERRGARVALITTAGFEDLIEIGRQARPRLYDLNVQREPPLVSRRLRLGVRERVAAGGRILLRPSRAELERLRRRVLRSGAESLALCFLFSFANPAHERIAARALQGLGLPISVSHEILPEFREFERLSTVVINAYLAPKMGAYLSNLESLTRQEIGSGTLRAGRTLKTRQRKPRRDSTRIYVMQSSGGIATAARAAHEPVRTILSGPAGGVVASAWLAHQLGLARAISFDMGGTSTDVCLLDGAPRTTSETTVAGLPVAVPVLDVHSVGAGGGSLARLDAAGALRVGPESAGADPGPICYARGGTRPTVTDAHLLLGRLDPEYFLGGEFTLDARAAEAGFEKFLKGAPRQSAFPSPRALAAGIVAVSNATMEKALRVISVERGYDPRDFSLICYGGAGGLHAADLARALRLSQVIVPRHPGAFSALGILLSDIVRDVAHSLLLPVGAAGGPREVYQHLDIDFQKLEDKARAELVREGFDPDHALVERRLDVRYQGQSYELSIPYTPRFASYFEREHQKTYGYAHTGRPLEIVNLRLRLRLPTPKPPARARSTRPQQPASMARVKVKQVWFGRRAMTTGVYERGRLRPRMKISGPAIIVEYSSTTVVPPDFVCKVDGYENLLLRLA